MRALWGLLEGCGEFREAEKEVPELLGQISGESGVLQEGANTSSGDGRERI